MSPGLPHRPSPGLRLRPLRGDDEAAVVAAQKAMQADEFEFVFGYEPGMAWSAFCEALEAQRLGTAGREGFVPATFLVADVGGVVIGRTSIRHRLNDFLAREGGHVGFGVLPGYRRRGYATEILRQSLVVARAVGVDRVLVTCDDDNVGSSTVIERCGGMLEDKIDMGPGTPLVRRYWID